MVFKSDRYHQILESGTLNDMKTYLRDLSPQERAQSKVRNLIDHLQNYPTDLNTRSSWGKIFVMFSNFKSEREIRVVKNQEKQKVVFLPESEGYNSTFIISLLESQVGKGTTRKVKRVYDFELQRMVASKNVSIEELEMLKVFRGSPGLESPLKWYSYTNYKGKPKVKCIEKLYDGCLSKSSKLNTEELFVVFRDVLSGLKVFHEGAFQSEDSSKLIMNFHQDVKLENIVFKRNESGQIIEACLIDFGAACRVDKLRGSPLYYSPEQAYEWIQDQLRKKPRTRSAVEDLTHHFVNYGQAYDLWALGVAFATLLFARDKMGLNFHVCKSYSEIYKHMDAIINLKQMNIDDELNSAQKSQDPERLVLWEIVKGLLKVEPFDRLSAKKALQMLRGD